MEVVIMGKEKKSKDEKLESKNAILSRSLLTGFIGGILWSGFGVVMYYFNFAEIAPKTYLLRSWLTAEWTKGWLGDIISILLIGLISLLTAFIYYGLFKKVNSLWMGILYGVVIWVVIFYLSQPIFTNVPALVDLSKNTIVSSLCLFILYGTFIGYSISYDYHDLQVKLKHQREAKS